MRTLSRAGPRKRCPGGLWTAWKRKWSGYLSTRTLSSMSGRILFPGWTRKQAWILTPPWPPAGKRGMAGTLTRTGFLRRWPCGARKTRQSPVAIPIMASAIHTPMKEVLPPTSTRTMTAAGQPRAAAPQPGIMTIARRALLICAGMCGSGWQASACITGKSRSYPMAIPWSPPVAWRRGLRSGRQSSRTVPWWHPERREPLKWTLRRQAERRRSEYPWRMFQAVISGRPCPSRTWRRRPG